MLKPQPILVVSGALLSACGVAALFAPVELGALLSAPGQVGSPLVTQLLGAGLFALGFLDWFSRYSTIGGIYGRPVVVANLAFFFAAATSLLRHAPTAAHARAEWTAAAVAGALALWFARYLLFAPAAASPVSSATSAGARSTSSSSQSR